MTIERPEALPSDYYVANFHALASFVYNTYPDLLSDTERLWYERIRASSLNAQQLYIRLLTRKGSVFRLSKLKYTEIRDLAEAALELQEVDLGDTSPPAELINLVSEYTKPELLRQLKLSGGQSRARVQLVQDILAAPADQLKSSVVTLQNADSWLTLSGHECWTVYRLCFFGNLYQDSSEFVLRDLGAVTYEQYDIDDQSRAFTTREEIDGHVRYFECVALLETISRTDAGQLCSLLDALPENLPGDVRLQRRLDRIRNHIARQLERLGKAKVALNLYTQSVHPPARERRVRIHMASEDYTKADELCQMMRSHPFSDAEKQVADRLHRQISKAIGRSLPALRRFRPDTSTLELCNGQHRVERLAQSHFDQFGSSFYSENALVNGVLGLLIWDVIFYPIPGVFYNPFQYSPSDFYDPDFMDKRKPLLQLRLAEVADLESFSARVLDGFSKHYGKANPLVRWRHLSTEMLELSLKWIPAEHWLAMFSRILANLRENTSGFPDLVFFPEEGGYEFIEIKGPGDVVQQNQKRWMQYFSEHRIPCHVVNVSWSVGIDNGLAT